MRKNPKHSPNHAHSSKRSKGEPGQSQAGRDAMGQHALGQIHGVGNGDDNKTAVAMVRPIKQIVPAE
jgi:hypothetical protein